MRGEQREGWGGVKGTEMESRQLMREIDRRAPLLNKKCAPSKFVRTIELSNDAACPYSGACATRTGW